MMTASEIRKQFLDFFEQKGHKIVPSVPIVVKNDPTLLFINAGMNPFKDIFLGNTPAQYSRIADTQKCLRVSGKHNDLEEVGVDTYHHTMFEMLGNWSFGDYFKEEAISYAWELLTEVYKLPKDRLYVTIFEGDAKENLAKDEESKEIWKKYIAEDRILLGNKKDNFWEMGDVGPCGPCTEIHFDSRNDAERARIDGKTLVNGDDPNVIEIWNNVFMEFNRKADKSLEPLPNKHVDTGMGFERLVRIIQSKTSNYDTDIFMPIIESVEKMCGKKYGFSDTKSDIAFRVIADHIRAISFTIADGQIPSNTGAGYVIRRILRRAVRYGYSFLDFQTPFMHQLVGLLTSQFSDVFPELTAQKDYLTQVIREEENSFFATLSKGIKIFNDLTANQAKSISGKDAFTLYDTYGFPFDLTQLMAQEAGIMVDEAAFEKELQIQKERSKNATKLETEDWEIIHPELDGKATQFIGYNDFESNASIVKIRKVVAKNQSFYQIVLDKTPFYAESGGQVGDSGALILGNQKINIYNTVKENDTIFHLTKEIEIADLTGFFKAQINKAKRSLTTKNHSATHLLQASLRNVLGAHVEQKGSLVNEKLLRFDFSHFAKLTDEEISKLEQMVNAKIQAQIDLKEEQNIPIDEAKSRGVMALFGEKYGEFVRVITFDASFSQELCGGTHVKNTGEIEYFKIISESSISAGVRRIEAITSQAVLEFYQGKEAQLEEIALALKNPQKLLPAIQNLMQETAQQRKTIEQYEKYIVNSEVQKISSSLSTPTGAMISLGDFSSEIVKNIAIQLRSKHDDIAIALVYEEKEKMKVAIAISDAIQSSESLMANQIAKELGQAFHGGGGGQPSFSVVTLEMSTSKEALSKKWLELVQK